MSAHETHEIRKIDFGNFVYDWYPAWADAPRTGRKIILNNGRMNLSFGYGKEPREFFLDEQGVKYGDLTGDASQEAVVALRIITSGTSRPAVIFVYMIENNRAKRIAVYETGDRWDYGYHNAFPENGQLIIEPYKPTIVEEQGQKYDMSSSEAYIRDYYHWNGSGFTLVKTEELPVDASDNSPWVARRRRNP